GVAWVVGNSHKAAIASLLAEDAARPAAAFLPLDTLRSRQLLAIESDLRPLGSVVLPPEDARRAAAGPATLVGDIAAQRQLAAAAFFGGSVEDRTRPNLKIQDGCNNRCSFCIIPSVRGFSRSLPAAEVLSQIRALCGAGYREVVLSGVNLGQYGRDLRGHPRLVELVQLILEQTPLERLRLSSVEPLDFTDPLLNLMASTSRIARHVHAPLQSGSDRILRRMRRKYCAAQYCERIAAARDRMPDAAFGADVIVGFPGETGEDFDATLRLIEELPFSYLHVFPFSRRPGTPADRLREQIPAAVARERGRVLRELAAEKNRCFRERHIGKTLRLLTLGESSPAGTLALSDNYLRVVVRGEALPANQWVEARIAGMDDGSLFATRAVDGAAPQRRKELSPSMRTCASA
ncbi:MAG TPA: MiaB/RimO family radical SAM methylthiotransferase, partial [Terriglobia bacterium]|nr:MiaB/RimO family radical SAM methylthiotransferase [Terriglobia bacterium]